jgi:hypothetical protein
VVVVVVNAAVVVEVVVGGVPQQVDVIVTDVLEATEQEYVAKIHQITEHGATYLIESITCPLCDNPLIINRHWNCYFCECDEHGKKVFDIIKVERSRSSSGKAKELLPEENEDY